MKSNRGRDAQQLQPQITFGPDLWNKDRGQLFRENAKSAPWTAPELKLSSLKSAKEESHKRLSSG